MEKTNRSVWMSQIFCWAIGLIAAVTAPAQAEMKTVDAGIFKVMQMHEVTFHAQKTYANAYMEVDLWVDLNGPDGLNYRIPAFWDGSQIFRVRLVATKPGVWNWSTGTGTGDPGLDNQNGSFKATAWTEAEIEENPNRRGFIRVASNKRTLEYADGTPFFHTGDTWWTALTHIFAWGTDDGLAGISFQDAIAKRKSQGFNGISMIACFPSDTLNSIWESGKLVRKVAEDGSTPFFVDTDQSWKTAPDYTRINPSYWQHADRKMQHMWEQGFVAQLESVRRHEEWYNENQAEKDAFTNYIRYMWARWGCYNVIFNWVHADANNKQHVLYRPMVVKAAAELGKPPYGQPRAVMTPRSNLEMGWLDLEPSILEIHSWSNYGRDGECITGLREMFHMEDFAPLINLEPFYPGLVAGFNPRPANMNETEAGQFIAYGCVLNGGALAGHVWGDAYYGGCAPASDRIKGDIPALDPQRNAFDKFNSASMGKLKDFMLDPGHDYRVLEPARDNLADPKEEFQCLALAPDKSFGLGFIAANYGKRDIINLTANVPYKLEWYNIDTGVWSTAVTVTTDATGKLIMPNKPNTKGWAFRIRVDAIHVHEVVEESFTAQNTYNNPYIDVDLWVNLNGPDGLSYRIPAFWDGGQTFRVRLVATQPGTWSWSTGNSTSDSGLDGKTGTFDAIAWTEAELEENPNRRGFIRLSPNRRTFEYADGTPFFFTIDTRWCALTGIYAWGSDAGMSGMSFQDVVDRRKAQGFNSIGIVACYPSDTLAGIWTPTDGAKVAEDGSTPFVIANPADKKFGVDYTRINPVYWQLADRKMKYMADYGFAPFFETVRKHELWYQENQAEQDAFVNFTRYMWARYGCYNMLYTWIHSDAGLNMARKWQSLINSALDALGDMPYGQPRTIMGAPSSVDAYHIAPEPVIPYEAFDLYNVSNRYRDYRMFGGLRAMAFKTNPHMNENCPTMPGANLEGFYPAYFNNLVEPEFDGPYTGKALDETDLGRKQMSQFMMYGSVLNDGFGGHAWGDCYYPGVSSQTQQSGNKPPTETDGEANIAGFDKWGVATMGHLKTFILDRGHDYRTLRSATLTHQVDTEREFRVLALNEDQSVGLGFIAANITKTDLINLIPDSKYKLEWYNIDTGVWSSAISVTTDAAGRLSMPSKPNTKGWAFRIRRNQ